MVRLCSSAPPPTGPLAIASLAVQRRLEDPVVAIHEVRREDFDDVAIGSRVPPDVHQPAVFLVRNQIGNVMSAGDLALLRQRREEIDERLGRVRVVLIRVSGAKPEDFVDFEVVRGYDGTWRRNALLFLRGGVLGDL